MTRPLDRNRLLSAPRTQQLRGESPRTSHISKMVLSIVKFGGAEGTRTPDPLLAKQVLSQLSYGPTRMAQDTISAYGELSPGIDSPSIVSCTTPKRSNGGMK